MQYEEEDILTLIVHSGEARSLALKALACARMNQIQEANHCMAQADQELNIAHRIQMRVIQKDLEGKLSRITLLAVHAQDHLMCSLVVRDLAKEILLMKQSTQVLEGETHDNSGNIS